nr:uncharacterized protein LOC113805781 [Penaeus vannamei]
MGVSSTIPNLVLGEWQWHNKHSWFRWCCWWRRWWWEQYCWWRCSAWQHSRSGPRSGYLLDFCGARWRRNPGLDPATSTSGLEPLTGARQDGRGHSGRGRWWLVPEAARFRPSGGGGGQINLCATAREGAFLTSWGRGSALFNPAHKPLVRGNGRLSRGYCRHSTCPALASGGHCGLALLEQPARLPQ